MTRCDSSLDTFFEQFLGDRQFDVAINIASSASGEDVRVLHAIKEHMTPPHADALLKLPDGMFNLPHRDYMELTM